jgi:hypothetical protein
MPPISDTTRATRAEGVHSPSAVSATPDGVIVDAGDSLLAQGTTMCLIFRI